MPSQPRERSRTSSLGRKTRTAPTEPALSGDGPEPGADSGGLGAVARRGGIVVVGGRSSRMGASKASLAWHGSTLVRRAAGIVARGVGGPVLLIRSPGQALPRLPDAFEVLDDFEEGRGPLGGLSVGLAALSGRCEVAYVSSTDVPFLHPAFVRRVLDGLEEGSDACVPCVRGFCQPLAAAYRVGLARLAASLLSSGQLRVSMLAQACSLRLLDEEALLSDAALASADPGLDSVTNLNDPEDYGRAIARPEPVVQVRWLAAHPLGATNLREGRSGPRAPRSVHAATLGRAARAIGVSLESATQVALNGEPVPSELEEPLAEGDLVTITGGQPAP